MIKKKFNSKVLKNISWLIGARIIQMIFSFIVGILTARYLGPNNYGLINYGAVYTGIFSSVCSLGLNSIVVKELIDKKDSQGETLGTIIVLKFIASSLSVIAIYSLSSIIDANSSLTRDVVLLCSFGLIFQSFTIFEFWFQSRLESKMTALATMIAYIIVSVYRVYLLINGYEVRWFAVATSIDYLCIALILYLIYKHSGGPQLKFSFDRAKSMIQISYHFILSSLMVSIYGNTDKFMIQHILKDGSEVGYYSTAVSICSMWTFVLQAIIDSFTPTIMEMHKTDYQKYKKRNIQLYAIIFYISLFVSLFIMLFANFGISFLYGNSYLGAVAPLRIVTWYTAFSYLGVARNAWIVCENKQKYLKYLYISAALLNIVLNFFLIPLLGSSGAALASLITQIFTSIILPFFIKEIRENAMMIVYAILGRGLIWNKGE